MAGSYEATLAFPYSFILFDSGALVPIIGHSSTPNPVGQNLVLQPQRSTALPDSTSGNLVIDTPAPTGAGAHSGLILSEAGVPYFTANVTGLTLTAATLSSNLTFSQGVVSPTISQASTTNATGQTLTIGPQASTAVNGTPGDVVVALPSPTGSGSHAHFKITDGTSTFQIGDDPSSGAPGLWLVPAGFGAPRSGQSVIATNGSYNTIINGVGGGLYLECAGSVQAFFSSISGTCQLVGPNLCIGGAFAGFNFNGASGVVQHFNQTALPTANPVGSGYMYADAGAGKWRGSSGTITTFGPADPHCPVCGMDFVTEHESETYGYLSVCLNCMAKHVGDQPYIVRDKAKRNETGVKHPGHGRLGIRMIDRIFLLAASACIAELIHLLQRAHP